MTIVAGYTGSTIAHALAQANVASTAKVLHQSVARDSTGSVTVLFTTISDVNQKV